ncbi:S-methyl-5'-thioadenosine phosphorylase [Geomonas sp. Red69]|uniref:S-methyl-5'-thioadenosine phosphorylase n=1 Tax=Geomonas diazotrophica TaxID=2843197 RepID=A0ABX8JGZ5_9BACT|nr:MULTISPECIES: S-methyl-5'-thioadenosine phosphorylase [Geomonas]MBU5638200.1 S-methyl-5'-thioadenosine phosphorylase [Geomonas diazotrophica]QWV95919.1 S-methyl-5'-thioadenosine phosphorylase [Geomonas nitrogeniifigens]QXE85005.1 S-methyl-5'-thioadenosine phosphorylase [Geomonas nitrogeniifigens]
MANEVIGVIGGSGLYEMEGMTGVTQVTVDTPFGRPSDEYVTGTLDGVQMVFLPRHGKGHRFTPSEVNYRANVYGMKKLGVTRIISVSAVGSLKEEIVPGHIVVPDQFIDRTRGFRKDTFFGNGVVGHVQFADPVCGELSEILYRSAGEVGATVHKGGCYVCMEGPAFSTRAESHLYRSFGASIIGMTNLTEAKLAREAEICYGVIALSTDYDCWHESHDDVSVEAIIEIIKNNVATAKKIIRQAVARVAAGRGCACGEALKYAVISDTSVIPVETRENLELILGKYL